MTEPVEHGAPFYFATQQPPTATAIDEDIYLAVTTRVPDVSGKVEVIDIILSIDFAKAVVLELSSAIVAAGGAETG